MLITQVASPVRKNAARWGAFPKIRHSPLKEEEEEDKKKENVILWNLNHLRWKFSPGVK